MNLSPVQYPYRRHLVLLGVLLAMLGSASASVTEYRNSLGMRFRPVPGTGVWFSIWETRVSDYRAFSQQVGRDHLSAPFPQSDDDPVVQVSWDDASAFCGWLTRQEAARLPKGARYRLPSSAEWDRAVGLPRPVRDEFTEEAVLDRRALRLFPWGRGWPPPSGSGNYHPSLQVDDFPYTSPVGSFAANRYGLHDLGGNVWEWTADWYNESPDYRVLRGGSWRMRNPGDLLSSFKVGNLVRLRLDTYGFRCVLQLPRGGARSLPKWQ